MILAHPVISRLLARLLFVCSLCTVFTQLNAQTQEIKDSLFSVLKNTRTDIDRIKTLNALSYEHYDFDDSIGFHYAQQALTLAKKTDYPFGLQYAYTMVGVGYFSFGDYRNALKHFRLSSTIPIDHNNHDHYLYNMMLTGNILTDIGQYDSAQQILEAGLNLAVHYNNTRRIAGMYKSKARIQIRLWQNDEALRNLKFADSIRNAQNDYERADFAYLYSKIYLNQSDLKNATLQIDVLCTMTKDIDDYLHKSLCHLMQSALDQLNGQYPTALSHAFQALEITKIYNYPYLRAQIYLQIGLLYSDLSEFDIASEFFFRVLKITEEKGIDPLSAQAYANLGLIFKDQKNYLLSLKYVDQAEKLFRKMEDKRGIGNSYNNRGLVYKLQKKYDESLIEHKKALTIQESINNQIGLANSYFNTAAVYEAMGNYVKALELQNKALLLDEVIGLPTDMNLSYIGMANLLIKVNRMEEAKRFLEKSSQLVEKTQSNTLQRSNFEAYINYYRVLGDFKSAFEYSQKFRNINDSIFSESSSLKIAEMQSLYDVERKEQQIELLSKESALQTKELALQKSRITNQNLIIIFGSLAFILVAILLYSSIRSQRNLEKAQRNLSELNEELMTQSEELRESNDSLVEVYTKLVKQQDEIQQQAEELMTNNNDLAVKRNEIEAQAEELREANETISAINQHLEEKVEERTQQLKQAYIELDTFFYRSSHDFRRPITTFIGLAEVAKITSKDESTLELFAKVKETALSLDRMIRKLQTISDVGAQKMVYKEILIRELISNILDTHKDELESKKIKVIQEIELHESFNSYGALVNVIIENLIENAIQFSTPLDPFIKIKAFTNGKTILLQVEDNGHGIPEEYHERIFDMYFRASISSKGNGLGLYIVKKAVSKLDGAIHFKTNLHNGTVFTVELPQSFSASS